ncbi:hypothetical protein N5K21_22395 [Rhizobium pusense]|uniref:Uncharacterized protein n=2 Tax=Agrobacterium pusense TaxID=648995 RepID=A0A6H0ZRI5_9HYPH|nr:hypothetical protein [Agrobacterium pusense]MDH2091485.1 hypothetical protein [Agrobacterium pusense]QIX22624.1 hypothetical protein FOB41_16490 [Agrobacterium pusense]
MINRRFMLGIVPAFVAVATPSLAATKAMECERYQVGADGFKSELFVYRIIADLDAGSLKLDLTKQPAENKTGKFPIATGDKWKIVWKSKDSLRIVGLITDYPNNPFESPVMVLDVDFATVRSAYKEAGGLTDFDTVVSDPWKYECKRLD